jgi:peptidoglycan hydrolase-like protein with peptidoglycan-binding domain
VDYYVRVAQTWLNDTYGGVSGWVEIDEDGITGWATIYGLRRGLQHQLGISPVSSGFGPATTTAFMSQIGTIHDDSVGEDVLRLLSAALWCKGWSGLGETDTVAYDTMSASVASIRGSLGLGDQDPSVDVKLMASLLSMDAYTTLPGGSVSIRKAEQWLNATFSDRRDFALVPCDGLFSRQVQTALLLGLQYEFGMADGVANGSFGPGTRNGLATMALVGPSDSDNGIWITEPGSRFVHLFQAALRFNGFAAPFAGTFDSSTSQLVREFQEFMALDVTGAGDFGTWCALLVSSGDTTRPTVGFDCAKQLTAGEASGAVAAGYRVAGRYLVGTGKFLGGPEMDGMRAAGLDVFLIHERNGSLNEMTHDIGRAHGLEAMQRARVLGMPDGAMLYFCVDFDPTGATVAGPVLDYFRGVHDALTASISFTYRAGVYGTRNVCTQVINASYAEQAFIAGMSTGWSGNMGMPMPTEWCYSQIATIQAPFAIGRTFSIDKDVVSPATSTAIDLSRVVTPPAENDGSVSPTGFDAFFQLFSEAKVSAEVAMTDASTLLFPLKSRASYAEDYILSWLQLPSYSTDLWSVYTPYLDTSDLDTLARTATFAGLDAAMPSGYASQADWLTDLSTRDVMHFAATLHGYRTWGLPSAPGGYSLGDLGGWPLDLLQVWGDYVTALTTDPHRDLSSFMSEMIGAASGSSFSGADIVADADAFLVARRSADQNCSLEEAMRTLFNAPAKVRSVEFLQSRFDGASANVESAFRTLVDGIDAWGWNVPFSRDILLRATKAQRLPTQEEATICARAFASVLASGAT